MRVLLIGHGRMGRLVESLAAEYGATIAGILDSRSAARLQGDAPLALETPDVAIDFSHADAVPGNALAVTRRGINLVIGTTGWQSREPEVREAVAQAGTGVVAAPNFATGVVLFEEIVARAAHAFAGQAEFGAWLHEAHHVNKKDAPSGTALHLVHAMRTAGYERPVAVTSTRAGHFPGTHTLGFDGPAESVMLTHTARDRSAFARGALVAARWLEGRHGWFTMRDVLGLTQ